MADVVVRTANRGGCNGVTLSLMAANAVDFMHCGKSRDCSETHALSSKRAGSNNRLSRRRHMLD